MSQTRRTAPPTSRPARGRPPAKAPTPASSVLALQRAIGNTATRRLLRKESADRFKVVVVPDGDTGVSQAVLTRALTVVRQVPGHGHLRQSQPDRQARLH